MVGTPAAEFPVVGMMMENLVMTTALTIEELDASLSTAAASVNVCVYCVHTCLGPEELDATAEATAFCSLCATPLLI